MTPASFSVLVTARFERDLRKLLKSHPDLAAVCAQVVAVLGEDPYNRSRSHPIKNAALAYYHVNRDEIETDLAQEEAAALQWEQQLGSKTTRQ